MSPKRLPLQKEQVKQEIAKQMTTGLKHHSYLEEKVLIKTVLSQGKDQ